MALQIMIDVVIVNVSFLAALYLRYEKGVPVSVAAALRQHLAGVDAFLHRAPSA